MHPGAGPVPLTQAQQHSAICHLLPAAGTRVAWWVMGQAELCLCLAQHTGAWGKALQYEQGTAIHRTVQGAAGKLLDLEPDFSLLGPFMVIAESGQSRTWQRCQHPPVLTPSLGCMLGQCLGEKARNWQGAG